MALNRINADSIADGTVIASDIANNTITIAKITSTAFATLTSTANSAAVSANTPSATANSAAIYANGAFAQANTAASTGKAIAMSIVFG